MKIRTSFVSNSSSSSFVCQVCNETRSGWDMGLDEADMYTCEKGHTFCQSHATYNLYSNLTWQDKQAILQDEWLGWERIKELEDVRTEEDWYNRGYECWWEDFMMDVMYQVPKSICPICTLKTVTNTDMLNHLLRKHNLDRSEVADEMRREYMS